jgi:hypothetical protein
VTRAHAPVEATRWVAMIAIAYLALHLPFLAPSLEDIDSINFALGLHRFDIVQHQPHPPGYPVYILLGRLSLWLLTAVSPLSSIRADALALAVWSALGGVVAIAGAARLFAAVESRFGDPREKAVWPVALLAASPLFWMSGLRPMSDMPGLAAVLWSQALLVEGTSDRRRAVAGVVLAALSAGIRIQTLALTTPVLVVMLFYQRRAGAWWLVSRIGGGFAVGLGVWAVPLLQASGGLSGYLVALGTQAGEDFAWVNMLWSNPTPRRLAFNLYETLVLPWHSVALAAGVGVAAVVGGVAAILTTPRAAVMMAFAFVPYLGYHLLLQETITVRYALPVLPLVAWLAMRGASTISRPRWPRLALVAVALIVAVFGGAAYGRQAHPAYLALADAGLAAQLEPPAKVFAHFGLRRSLQHGGGGLPFVEPRREYEWLGPADYWRGGGEGEVWFFAEPRRTDLALIDPAGRTNVRRYDWAAGGRAELSGTRPTGVEWYRMTPPGWFAGEGWSLTPETGGLTRATGSGPGNRPIEVFVKRRPDAVHLVLGGRHLSDPGGADADLQLLVDGRPFDRWTVRRSDETFLRFLTLPPAMLDGASGYATLSIVSQAVGGGTRADVAIRQFDAQSESGVVYGFGEGWHEPEYAPETGARWRWTSERSVLHMRGTAQPTRLTLKGETPLKYFDAPPTIRVTSAGQLLKEFRPDADFEVTIDVAPTVWRDGAASIAIESSRVYLPGIVEGTADARHLGLRLFDARINTALP